MKNRYNNFKSDGSRDNNERNANSDNRRNSNGNDSSSNSNGRRHEDNDNGDDDDTLPLPEPPSFDESSIESKSSLESESGGRRRGDGKRPTRLIGGPCDDGKIRHSSSRDTISTASVSHFDGNSSTGTLSHGQHHSHTHHQQNRLRLRSKRSKSSRLYSRQINLLLSSTGVSLVLFLFFFLNIFAFAALMTFAGSISMLIYTSYVYIMYLVQTGELNVFTLLPESTREYLMNTSLHEMLTDNSGYLENRYLLLYFIPGLSPEQILQMVNRLPQRHRDMVLGQGGMARMILPTPMQNLIRTISGSSSNDSVASNNTNTQPSLQHQHQQLSLPVIAEGDEEPSLLLEEEVTTRDAWVGIFNTVRGIVTGRSSDEDENEIIDDIPEIHEEELYDSASQEIEQPQHHGGEYQDMVWENDNQHEEGETETPTNTNGQTPSTISMMAAARIFGLNAPNTSQLITTSSSSPPTTVTATSIVPYNPQQQQDRQAANSPIDPVVLEQERVLEGEIINDAFSLVANNYYDVAAQGLASVAQNVVDNVAPTVIRAGIRLSSVSSLGLLGMYSSRLLGGTSGSRSSLQQVHMMGSSSARSSSGSSGSITETRTGRYAVRGLISTLILGLTTVGSAYLTRRLVHRYRESLQKESDLDEEETDKDD